MARSRLLEAKKRVALAPKMKEIEEERVSTRQKETGVDTGNNDGGERMTSSIRTEAVTNRWARGWMIYTSRQTRPL